jgi:hypothetical protein
MSARRVARVAVAIGATGILLYGLARLSAAPLTSRQTGSARLRLSWTARPERIEVCRSLTEAELAQREEHMRQRLECDGRFATYALRVESDGRTLHESVVRGAGLRHDRPLYGLREANLPPGRRRVRISLNRREKSNNDSMTVSAAPVGPDTGLFAGRAQRETIERSRRTRAAIPARVVLDTTLVVSPDRVVVVSFDPERRAFRVLTAPER